jgi:NAD(P)-dependent dehydrogenase (short-subunit alcohol dehydrogenase family)
MSASKSKSGSFIVVISGANRGIGLELTRGCLERGHQVIAGTRHPAKSEELRELAGKFDGQLRVLELDISSDGSVESFSSQIDVDHVDVLINNAGIYMKGDGPADRVDVDIVTQTFATNVGGTIRLTQALLPLVRKAKGGRVANISSQMGSIDDNSSGSSLAYRISKTAVNMFTKTLACDEKNVKVMSLHPGWVKTEMGGAGATLEPRDSAAGLLKVIFGQEAQSGSFHNYDGATLAW